MRCIHLVLVSSAVAGLASCRRRAAESIIGPVRVVSFGDVIQDLSALMNLVLVGCMVGMGLAIAVACVVRSWSPMLSRLSLGAAVGFAAIFGLAVMLKVSLPILAWAVVAMLAMGLVSVAVVLHRRLAANPAQLIPVRPEVVSV